LQGRGSFWKDELKPWQLSGCGTFYWRLNKFGQYLTKFKDGKD